MSSSIRTFLLINLLLCVTLITSLAIIGNLFLEHSNLQNHLDTQLSIMGFTLQAFAEEDIIQHDEISEIQDNINSIPGFLAELHGKIKGQKFKKVIEKIQFQVWKKDGTLLLRSYGAPQTPLAIGRAGFSDKTIAEEPWRVFTTYSPKTGLKVVVAERYNFRRELETRITQDSIFIMLVTYPFLGLLIWIIIGRGLDSIKRVTEEVKERDRNYLEPVDVESVPSEIQPFITELNELFDRLQEAFDREKRFAADAAHELKTPLAALRTHAQVALKANNIEGLRRGLEKVVSGVKRSTHVVQQLLTLSRMVPEANLDKIQAIDLKRLTSEVVAELTPAAIAKQTDIECIMPKHQLTLIGNQTAIAILIRNLTDNAIRYSPEGSHVRIVMTDTKTCITFSVIDNGPGIPEETRTRVFERFFRVLGNPATGSGLGLGIVQQIAKLHHADIELDTPKTGKGLEFRVIFPKQAPSKKSGQ